MKKNIIIGGILAGTAVILGAMNAHALKAYFDADTSASFATGVRYQMYHALAILIIAALYSYLSKKQIERITYLFLSGTFLFSGSIYALCTLKCNGIAVPKLLGLMTPLGGIILIAGWLYLIFSAAQKNKDNN